MNKKVSNNISVAERSFLICNTLFHQFLAVVTIFIFWTIFYNYKLNSIFSWHMILSALAYVPLMGEAIILFSGNNVWSRNIERTTKYWIHGVILIISAILVTVGASLIISEKSGNHFKSTHGWTGLVSWILVLISQFLGLLSAKSQMFTAFLRPVYIKFVHNLLGIFGYIFGIVSLCYGLETGAFSRLTTKDARIASYCLLGITTAWSILAALKSAYHQIKSILT